MLSLEESIRGIQDLGVEAEQTTGWLKRERLAREQKLTELKQARQAIESKIEAIEASYQLLTPEEAIERELVEAAEEITRALLKELHDVALRTRIPYHDGSYDHGYSVTLDKEEMLRVIEESEIEDEAIREMAHQLMNEFIYSLEEKVDRDYGVIGKDLRLDRVLVNEDFCSVSFRHKFVTLSLYSILRHSRVESGRAAELSLSVYETPLSVQATIEELSIFDRYAIHCVIIVATTQLIEDMLKQKKKRKRELAKRKKSSVRKSS